MFEAITSCIFFGTPFSGAPVASNVAMYASIAERFEKAIRSTLLDPLAPENEGLRELEG
jgi:hypothetical protein